MNRSKLGLALAASIAAAPIIASSSSARADSSGLKWAVEGYFKTRTVYLTNLARQDTYVSINPNGPEGDNQITIPEISRTSYIYSSGRILPTVSYKKLAKLSTQLDVLNDVLWGDNNGLSAAPLFAVDGTNTSINGGSDQVPSIALRRAWVEFQVPIGLMRVGRMPSHWGMGLLANGGGTGTWDPTTPPGEPPRKIGDSFTSEDFGEKHFGSTADRILFITKPLTIYKTLAHKGDTESKLIVGYAYDKLSEAPFLPFEPFERQFRPFGQQGFISRGGDDVNEHVGLIVWNDPEWHSEHAYTDELRLGLYGVLRTSKAGSTSPSEINDQPTCGLFDGEVVPCKDTGSKVYIGDVWWRVRYGALFTEGEAYYIGGQTFGGIPFPSRNQKKDAAITAGVARFGYLTKAWDSLLEVGHASGDDDLGDEHFKQRAIHPDFNVGLILYEEILRELSARVYGVPFLSEENPNGATGFFSNGGVINSNYLFPRGRWRPPAMPNLEVTGGLLLAWVDTLGQNGVLMFDASKSSSKFLGAEVDLGVHAEFAHNMRFALETGYLRFGDALKAVYPNADSSFTLQTSIGFLF